MLKQTKGFKDFFYILNFIYSAMLLFEPEKGLLRYKAKSNPKEVTL